MDVGHGPLPFLAVDTLAQRGTVGCPRSQSGASRSVPPGNLPEVTSSQDAVKVGWGGPWAVVLHLGGQACE